MSDNDTNDTEYTHPSHFMVCPEIMPKPGDTPLEWEQRVVMLAEMAESLSSTLYTWLRINVPMLADYEALPAQLIAAIGVICRGIRDTGREQLEKRGTAPLDIEEDQARMVRERLADPSCTAEERDYYLAWLAHRINCTASHAKAPEPAEEEWPTDIMIDGD